MPFLQDASNLSLILSPVNSLSYWAKESKTFSINLPIELAVLKLCVTATKLTLCSSNIFIISEKSESDLVKRSIL